MLKYILKRLGLSIIILLGVSIIIYTLVRCMPFDYVEQEIAKRGGQNQAILQQTIDAMYKATGLKDPIIVGYGKWLLNLCKLDLGRSYTENASVVSVIFDHMGTSFAIAFIAMIFEYLIAIPLGVTAATHQYSIRDYVVTIFVVIGLSLPSFFFARLLQGVFAARLKWFPVQGMLTTGKEKGFEWLGSILWHMVLPMVSIIVLGIGGTMRYTRTNMLEVLNSDYIRTARAKGLAESKVIYKHAFRNTMIPIVTMLAGVLPGLFSGAMITEEIFGIEGIGRVALRATTNVDVPFIMGYNMFLAFLSVIGVLLSDLMYMVVDPRVKLS